MSGKPKRASADKDGGSDNGFRGYVKHRLTAEQKSAFDDWRRTYEFDSFVADLDRAIDNGYKFSVGHDSYGGGCLTSLTCRNQVLDDDGYVLTARAPDLLSAMLLLMYKHYHILMGDWSAFHEENSEISMWG